MLLAGNAIRGEAAKVSASLFHCWLRKNRVTFFKEYADEVL